MSQPNGANGPTGPNEKATPDGETEPVELTEEEKKLDEQYQRDLREHKAKIMTEIGQMLVEKADDPVYLVTRTETIEYSSPILMGLAGSYLMAGPKPIDPLADKRDCGGVADVVHGMLDSIGKVASMWAMQMAMKQQQRVSAPPPPSPPPPVPKPV